MKITVIFTHSLKKWKMYNASGEFTLLKCSLLFATSSHCAATAAKSLQSCPILCDPIDSSPPGSPVPGILLQEHWSGLPFPSPMQESEKWKWSCSVVSDLGTPWTAAYQAPPSMGFSRQEWVAISFSRGSSRLRGWTRVSRITGRRFTL